MPDSKVLGQNYPRVDAADKASGRSNTPAISISPACECALKLQTACPHPASSSGRRAYPGYRP
jgi:hypothetical protein